MNRSDRAYQLFVDLLPELDTLGPKEFRMKLRIAYAKEFSCTDSSASSLYQTVKKRVIAEGLCEDFARGSSTVGSATKEKPVKPVATKNPAASMKEEVLSQSTGPWKVVDTNTGALITHCSSRDIALSVRKAGQSVVPA